MTSGAQAIFGQPWKADRSDDALHGQVPLSDLPDFLPEQGNQPDGDYQQEGDDDRAEHLLSLGAIGKLASQQASERLAEDEAGDEQNDQDMGQDAG